MSDLQSVLALSVDRLRAAYLGCYGNTWIATPALNRLATESFIFDEAHAAGPELAEFFRDAWYDANGASLSRRAAAAGFSTLLVTDDAEVAKLGDAAGFEEIVELPRGAAAATAEELEDTHLASVFAAAIQQLDTLRGKPFLAWVHLGSLGQTWDAPTEFRERYHEEDDAPLPTFVEPPCKLLEADFDPDERWGYALAYAAQVSAFDACLDMFLEHLRSAGTPDHATLMIHGVRGYPLGEHRRVGPIDHALVGELLHVPWIVRFPHGGGASERTPALVVPQDLGAAVTRVLTERAAEQQDALAAMLGESPSRRERLEFSNAQGETAIRTEEWFLRRVPGVEGVDRVALFAKPDDRWEINDVHDRCVDVVEELLGEHAPG